MVRRFALWPLPDLQFESRGTAGNVFDASVLAAGGRAVTAGQMVVTVTAARREYMNSCGTAVYGVPSFEEWLDVSEVAPCRPLELNWG